MLAFVYDGQKNYVYVNGVLVADREIRTGPYGLIGFWIGGSNGSFLENGQNFARDSFEYMEDGKS